MNNIGTNILKPQAALKPIPSKILVNASISASHHTASVSRLQPRSLPGFKTLFPATARAIFSFMRHLFFHKTPLPYLTLSLLLVLGDSERSFSQGVAEKRT